jgi:predicted GIY-YIG superfamily endonuclease
MPKVDIDYTNTLFYKISCKDTNITDVYIGHTTNFVQRKSAHKHACINPKTTNYPCKLYTVIRQHGGWDNWCMDIIAYHECKDNYEARKKEQEYFILYNATLNSIEPMPRPKCANTPTPIINLNNVQSKQFCEKCNFKCSKYSNYKTHLLTAKHINRTSRTESSNNAGSELTCDCGKSYKARNSLWYHKRVCKYKDHALTVEDVPSQQPPQFDSALVLELLKQNQEFKELLAEQNKHMIEQQQQLIDAVNRLR